MRPRDREAERPVREDKGRRRVGYDENGGIGEEKDDKATEEGEVVEEGELTVARGATCLMN